MGIVRTSYVYGGRGPRARAGIGLPKFGGDGDKHAGRKRSAALPEQSSCNSSKSLSDYEREAKRQLREKADAAENARASMRRAQSCSAMCQAKKRKAKGRLGKSADVKSDVTDALYRAGLFGEAGLTKRKQKKEHERKGEKKQKTNKLKTRSTPNTSSVEKKATKVVPDQRLMPAERNSVFINRSERAQRERETHARQLGISEVELVRRIRAIQAYLRAK